MPETPSFLKGNHLILLPLALIILTSGCTMPGGLCIPGFPCGTQVEETHDVIVIESLQALPREVPPGGTINLIAIVSNKADIDAEIRDVPVCVELYDYCSGMFTVQDIKGRETGENVCGTLSDGVPINLLRGEKKQIEWILKARSDVAVKTECNLKIRSVYPYSTKSLTTLHLIDYAEMQRRLNEGTYSEVGSYISVGYGPIKPYVRIEGTQPVPVSEDKVNSVLSVQIENKGDGFLSKMPGSDGEVAIKKSNLNVKPVESDIPEVKTKLDECMKEFEDSIELINRKSTKIVCPLNDTGVGNVPVESTKSILSEVTDYYYEFRDSLKVTVEPKF